MNFEEIEMLVIKWAKDREIFDRSSATSQVKKLQEELDELSSAVKQSNHKLAIDAIGDMLVVLTLTAKFLNVDMKYCYAVAYLEIKDRKGKMVDGLFVKE